LSPQVDVAVVGAGINGVAAASALARAGHTVALLEQFELGHTRGSSHGSSRIFRLSYAEPHYVRLAQEALAAWRALEEEAGEELILQTGGLDFGEIALENADALAECGVRHERLTGADVAERWPIRARADEVALFQPDGGIARADRALAVLLAATQAAGADVRERTKVTSLRRSDGHVVVETQDGALRARAVVVTAGAWSRDLLAPLGIDLPVEATRETIAYFALPDADELPTLIDDVREFGQAAYALLAPGVGLKAGHHRTGHRTDPEETGEPDPGLVQATADWVAQRYPSAGADVLAAETCIYTNTDDSRFVCSRHDRIVVGSACSGHGFKFAPVTGRRLADLTAEALV
jgi:sarcosine oxidase